jgi:hypothetical protein
LILTSNIFVAKKSPRNIEIPITSSIRIKPTVPKERLIYKTFDSIQNTNMNAKKCKKVTRTGLDLILKV